MKHRFIFVLVLAAVAPGLFAQTDTSAEAEPVRYYDVEVVVFKNVKAPRSREFILPVSSPSVDGPVFDLSSPASVKAAREKNYELLASEEFRLLDAVSKLVESARYELLAHVAWRQPGVELEQAMPVWIKGGKIYGNEYTSIDNQIEYLESLPANEALDSDGATKHEFDEQTLEAMELQLLDQQQAARHQGLYELEGKITISLSRYLHAYSDLVFRRPRLSLDPVLNPSDQEKYLANYSADTRILDNHRLIERRRMRSKNLHYLDNPEFAVLILITPYEAPAEVLPEDGQTPEVQG